MVAAEYTFRGILDISDPAYRIAKLVKTAFDRIQERTDYELRRAQIVTAYKRNQNLSDILIKSKSD